METQRELGEKRHRQRVAELVAELEDAHRDIYRLQQQVTNQLMLALVGTLCTSCSRASQTSLILGYLLPMTPACSPILHDMSANLHMQSRIHIISQPFNT